MAEKPGFGEEQMNKLARHISAALLAAAPAASMALGLGEIDVKSNLNEPLRAEIELIYSSAAEAEAAAAKLASAEDFARVGLDAGMITQPLQFTVGRNSQGRYVVNVSTAAPVMDPFVDFLIEVSWANGRLLREYVVLLDPPLVAPSTSVPAIVDQDAGTAAQPFTPPAPTQQPYSGPSSSSASSTGSGGSYGPVQSGDTLWQIASERVPNSEISVQQMMMMLLQLNPEAFQNNNINLLKRGAILRIPSEDDFYSYSEDQAQADVRAQNQSWQEYVRSRTGTTPIVSDAGVTADVSSTPPATAASTDSRLQLRPPASTIDGGNSATGGGANVGEMTELQTQLAGAREDLLTSEAENAELRSRVDELESLVERLRTLNIEDSELAALQATLADGADAAGEVASDAVDATADAAAAAGDVIGDGVDAAADLAGDVSDAAAELGEDGLTAAGELAGDVTDAAGDAVTAVGETAGEVADDVQDAASEVVSNAGDAANRAVDSIKTIQSRSTQDDGIVGMLTRFWPWLAGGLVALLGGGWLLSRRGREPELAPAGGGFSFDPGEEIADTVETSIDEIADDVAQELENVVDETSLIADIDDDPTDPQRHLSLLRSYYAAGEEDKFAVAAMRMQGEIDADAPAWQEVRTMGSALLPDNPMFAQTLDIVDDAADELTFDLDSAADSVDEAADTMGDAIDSDLDLALDAEASSDELSLDLELDDAAESVAEFTLDDSEATVELSLADSEPLVDGDLDLDLDLGDAAEAADAAVDDFASDVADSSDLDLDLDQASEAAAEQIDQALADLDDLDLGSDMLGGDDAVGTKLDLAETYMRMGDPDGARGMLEEVVADGNADQQARAKQLLDELDF